MQNLLTSIAGKLRSGHFNAAAKLARTGHKKHPKNPDFLKFSGIAFHEMHKHAEAIKHLSKALKLRASDPDIRRYLMASLLALGHSEKAEQALQNWLTATPGDAELQYLMAATRLQIGDFLGATTAATCALELRPRMTKARVLRGFGFFESKNYRAAVADFQDARLAEPANTEILLNLGSSLNELHRFDESRAIFSEAVKIAPDNLELRQSLASLLTQRGLFDDAKPHFEAILNLDPNNVSALCNLAEMSKPEQFDHTKRLLENALARATVTDHARASLLLSLATLLMDQGDVIQAAAHIHSSNKLRAKIDPYDPKQAENTFAKSISQFPTAPEIIKTDLPTRAPTPVFVIGLPRSGTTLSEMVLSAHSKIYGLGEYGAIQNSANRALDGSDVSPDEHARSFLADLPDLPSNTLCIVDKSPANYLYLGYIAQAFPDARFISVERDPREVAVDVEATAQGVPVPLHLRHGMDCARSQSLSALYAALEGPFSRQNSVRFLPGIGLRRRRDQPKTRSILRRGLASWNGASRAQHGLCENRIHSPSARRRSPKITGKMAPIPRTYRASCAESGSGTLA